MHYKELVKYSKKFEEVEPRHFFYEIASDLLERSMTLRDTVNALLIILLIWNKNFYNRKRFDKTHVDQFSEAVRKTRLLLKLIQNESLEGLEVDKELKIKGHTPKVAEIIEAIYDELSSVVGYTGASKTMHLLKKDLFVMWDTSIREYYKYNKFSCYEYLDFLLKMQRKGVEAIDTYCKEFKCSEVKAKERISSLSNNKPLTKLIDERNYVIHTKNIILS